MAVAQRQGGYLERPAPSGLADVIDIILDKGLVIDAYVRVSLVGIELLTVDARIVIASVDTYLRFVEAVILGYETGTVRSMTPGTLRWRTRLQSPAASERMGAGGETERRNDG